MCLKIRCDGECEKFCKIFWEVNRALEPLHFLAVAHGSWRDGGGVAQRNRGPRRGRPRDFDVAGRERAHQQQIGPAHIKK